MSAGIDLARLRAPQVVHELAREAVRAANRSNGGKGRYHDDGFSYDVAGTADETRHVALGGFWNDRTGRAAFGISPEDASAFRLALRARGFKVKVAEAEALLCAAAVGYLRAMSPRTTEQERTKKQLRRAWARANNLCIICCKNPADPNLVTCQFCRDRVAEARSSKRSPAAQDGRAPHQEE